VPTHRDPSPETRARRCTPVAITPQTRRDHTRETRARRRTPVAIRHPRRGLVGVRLSRSVTRDEGSWVHTHPMGSTGTKAWVGGPVTTGHPRGRLVDAHLSRSVTRDEGSWVHTHPMGSTGTSHGVDRNEGMGRGTRHDGSPQRKARGYPPVVIIHPRRWLVGAHPSRSCAPEDGPWVPTRHDHPLRTKARGRPPITTIHPRRGIRAACPPRRTPRGARRRARSRRTRGAASASCSTR